MTNAQKYILYGTAVLVVVLGSYVLTHKTPVVNQTVVKSYGATGDTYASMPMAEIGINTATITPASLFNGSGRDRLVVKIFLTASTTNAYGTTTLYSLQAATSTNSFNLNSNTNYLLNLNGYAFSATTTGYQFYSSTTPAYSVGPNTTYIQGLANNSLLWPAGTYINFVISSSTDKVTNTGYVFSNATGGSVNNNSSIGSSTYGFAGVEYYPQ